MSLKNFREIFMPYCLVKQGDGSWVVLNRDYKPVGFRTRAHVDYGDYPISVHLKKLTPALLESVSYEPIKDLAASTSTATAASRTPARPTWRPISSGSAT